MAPFQKSNYKLGDPIFMVTFPGSVEQFQVVRTFEGLKAKLRNFRFPKPSRKVYVCTNPHWVEMNEITEAEIELASCDEEQIAAELDRIREKYEVSDGDST